MRSVREVSESCFVPITVGGGIKTINDARYILSNGSDKVLLNSEIHKNKKINVVELGSGNGEMIFQILKQIIMVLCFFIMLSQIIGFLQVTNEVGKKTKHRVC